MQLIGISIESNQLCLPYFRLNPKLPLDRFTLFRSVSKLESGILPKLIHRDYSLFYRKRNKPDQVENLFQGKGKLFGLLNLSRSSHLVGFKNHLVYYETGEFKANSARHWELEQKGRELFDMFRESSAEKLKTHKWHLP